LSSAPPEPGFGGAFLEKAVYSRADSIARLKDSEKQVMISGAVRHWFDV